MSGSLDPTGSADVRAAVSASDPDDLGGAMEPSCFIVEIDFLPRGRVLTQMPESVAPSSEWGLKGVAKAGMAGLMQDRPSSP
jgi:hypothetical protein